MTSVSFILQFVFCYKRKEMILSKKGKYESFVYIAASIHLSNFGDRSVELDKFDVVGF